MCTSNLLETWEDMKASVSALSNHSIHLLKHILCSKKSRIYPYYQHNQWSGQHSSIQRTEIVWKAVLRLPEWSHIIVVLVYSHFSSHGHHNGGYLLAVHSDHFFSSYAIWRYGGRQCWTCHIHRPHAHWHDTMGSSVRLFLKSFFLLTFLTLLGNLVNLSLKWQV